MVRCKDCVHVDVCRGIYLAITRGKINSYEEFLKKSKKEHFEQQDIFPCDCLFYKDRARFVELPDVGDYDTVTTLDEAIDHCYQIATSTDETVCAECKAEPLRLCSWLGDLKRRIVAEQALKEREA